MSVSIDYLKRQAETLENNAVVLRNEIESLAKQANEIRDSIRILEEAASRTVAVDVYQSGLATKVSPFDSLRRASSRAFESH